MQTLYFFNLHRNVHLKMLINLIFGGTGGICDPRNSGGEPLEYKLIKWNKGAFCTNRLNSWIIIFLDKMEC